MKWCGGHGSLCSQTSAGKQKCYLSTHGYLAFCLEGWAWMWLRAGDFCTVCTARPYQFLALLHHSPQVHILNTVSQSILLSSQEMSHVLYTREQRLLIWWPLCCLYQIFPQTLKMSHVFYEEFWCSHAWSIVTWNWVVSTRKPVPNFAVFMPKTAQGQTLEIWTNTYWIRFPSCLIQIDTLSALMFAETIPRWS